MVCPNTKTSKVNSCVESGRHCYEGSNCDGVGFNLTVIDKNNSTNPRKQMQTSQRAHRQADVLLGGVEPSNKQKHTNPQKTTAHQTQPKPIVLVQTRKPQITPKMQRHHISRHSYRKSKGRWLVIQQHTRKAQETNQNTHNSPTCSTHSTS